MPAGRAAAKKHDKCLYLLICSFHYRCNIQEDQGTLACCNSRYYAHCSSACFPATSSAAPALPSLACLLGACWKASIQGNIEVEVRGYAAKLLLTPASHIDADEGAQQVQGTPNSGQVASAAPIQPVSRHGLVQMMQKPMSDQHASEEFHASPSIN